MDPRLNFIEVSPPTVQAMMQLEQVVKNSGLEPALTTSVKLRASQINGCAQCISDHAREARAHGEDELRLYELNAWREAPFYSKRERAALAWTEAVTLVAESRVGQEVYEEARRHFNEEQLVHLTLAAIAINGWNRLNVSFRTVPRGGPIRVHPAEAAA